MPNSKHARKMGLHLGNWKGEGHHTTLDITKDAEFLQDVDIKGNLKVGGNIIGNVTDESLSLTSLSVSGLSNLNETNITSGSVTGLSNLTSASANVTGTLGAGQVSTEKIEGTTKIENFVGGENRLIVTNSIGANTAATYYSGDAIILQRGSTAHPSFTPDCGGLRLHNSYTNTTWALFTNDGNDLNFAVNGSNRSYINDTGSNAQLNFTGIHRVELDKTGVAPEWEASLPGLVVSTTGRYNNVFFNKEKPEERHIPSVEEALPVVKLSSVAADKKAFGVIVKREGNIVTKDGKSYRNYNFGYFGQEFEINDADVSEMQNRYDVAGVGECAVWVVKENPAGPDPEQGDLIETSNIPGLARVQSDNIIRSTTIGKLTCDWTLPQLKANGSTDSKIKLSNYVKGGVESKLMGCVLYCG